MNSPGEETESGVLARSKWTDPAEHSINQEQEHREKCPETAEVSRTWVRVAGCVCVSNQLLMPGAGEVT